MIEYDDAEESVYYQDTPEGKEWADWAYNEYCEEQRKEKERRDRIADKIKSTLVTKEEDIILPSTKPDGCYDFACYTIGCPFATNDKKDYERHVVTKHYGKGLCYPGKVDIRQRGWKAQGRKWEILSK